jgi:hypothetical protein
MPTLLILDGFRFHFFSNDHEPPHVHVEKGDSEAKFNLNPIELVTNIRMKSKDLRRAEEIVTQHQAEFLERWRAYFNR